MPKVWKKQRGKERWRKREETPTRRIWISCELASAENWSILSCEGTRAANQGKRTCPMVYSPSVAARRASNRFGPMQRRYNALGLSVSWTTTIRLSSNQFSNTFNEHLNVQIFKFFHPWLSYWLQNRQVTQFLPIFPIGEKYNYSPITDVRIKILFSNILK